MKRIKAFLAVVIIVSLTTLTACNVDMVDTNYSFDTAYIQMGDGTVNKVSVKKWRDYENSDTVQVIADDGTVYLTHYANVVLVKEK